MIDLDKDIACLGRHQLEALIREQHAELQRLRSTLSQVTGLFAAIGMSEPEAGFVREPNELVACVRALTRYYVGAEELSSGN